MAVATALRLPLHSALPFFIQLLKLGGRFDPWVYDCPLNYQSNNVSEKVGALQFFVVWRRFR